MHELWSSASYEPHLLSLPFALAPATMLIVIAYTAVMRGAPTLRGFLLANFISLLPYTTVMMLSPSIRSRVVAESTGRTRGGRFNSTTTTCSRRSAADAIEHHGEFANMGRMDTGTMRSQAIIHQTRALT
jgi:hypothetical protein